MKLWKATGKQGDALHPPSIRGRDSYLCTQTRGIKLLSCKVPLQSHVKTTKSHWLNTRSFLAHVKLLVDPATLQDLCPPSKGPEFQASLNLCPFITAMAVHSAEWFLGEHFPLPFQSPLPAFSSCSGLQEAALCDLVLWLLIDLTNRVIRGDLRVEVEGIHSVTPPSLAMGWWWLDCISLLRPRACSFFVFLSMFW